MNCRQLKLICRVAGAAAVAALFFAPVSVRAAAQEPESLPEGAAAVVNGETISVETYREFYTVYAAQTYYHRLDQSQRPKAAREALDLLVSDALLVQEAKRRGVKGDLKKTNERLAALEKRFAKDEESRKAFEAQKKDLMEEILDDTRIEALRKSIMAAPAPDEADVRRFYDGQPELFTTPPATDLSIILLPVPPHGSNEDWTAAQNDAAGLYDRLKAGEDFAAIAKERSGHESASKGGALGLVHDGQLIDDVVAAIADLPPGGFTQPLRILEGIAIFKVNARQPAELQAFDDVRDRAAALLERESADKRWRDFLTGLRANARIKQAASPVELLRDH